MVPPAQWSRANGTAEAFVNELKDPFHRPRDGRVLLRVVSLELRAICRGADEARQDRVDPLTGREVVADDRLSIHPGRIERERDHYPGAVLAGRAVDQDGAVGAGDRAHRADDRVGTAT